MGTYLLGGRIFCARCKHVLTGQLGGRDGRYYRHPPRSRARTCDLSPLPWVPAEAIEQAVVSDVFDLLGNPAEIERAVKAAVPDAGKARQRRAEVEAELARVGKARTAILGLIEREAITEAAAEAKLLDLKGRERGLQAELAGLAAALRDVPDPGDLMVFTEWVGTQLLAYNRHGEAVAGGNDLGTYLGMSGPDKAALVAAVFDATNPDGTPAGVYVTPTGGHRTGPKSYAYELRGRLGAGLAGALCPTPGTG